MKRIISVCVAALMLTFALAGCSNDTKTSPSPELSPNTTVSPSDGGNIVDDIEDAVEDAKDKTEDAVEDAKDKMEDSMPETTDGAVPTNSAR